MTAESLGCRLGQRGHNANEFNHCMAASTPLDTTIAVVTPENIAFEYQLAGPFRRLPAYLIDIAVRWGVIMLVGFLLLMLGGLLSVASAFIGVSTMGLAMVAYFLISWFYGTVMEAYYNGRTVGKWACGIRVIDIEGRPISGRSALLRNLIRIADMAPVAFITVSDELPPIPLISTGMIALVCMVCTKRMQRLGDLAAGTMVIIDERAWRLPVAKVDDPRVPALASYVPGDYRVSRTMSRTLATYAERRHYLTPARRREIARHLTDPLIDRFEFRRDIDPDLLLYALYYKTFLAESSIEEPDLGPLRGYSPLARDANKVKNAGTPLQKGITSTAPVTPLGYPAKTGSGNAGDNTAATMQRAVDAKRLSAGSNITPPKIPARQVPSANQTDAPKSPLQGNPAPGNPLQGNPPGSSPGNPPRPPQPPPVDPRDSDGGVF